MTSADTQASHVLNVERGGSRLDHDLERFLSQLRTHLHGVHRAYAYYQTCKTCSIHEAVLCVNPLMWYLEEVLPSDFAPWYPETLPALRFADAAQLPVIAAHLSGGDSPHVMRWDGRQWVHESLADFANNTLWGVHEAHAQRCGAPTVIRKHYVGTSSFMSRLHAGTARINDLFRVVNGCVHTDTDVLLVNDYGAPLLLVEEYRPHIKADGKEDKKYTSFSRSLSRQAGGGLVVLLRTDDHPDGPLVEELWDTVRGEQLLRATDGVRGYNALGGALLNHPVIAPYLR